MLVKDFMTTDPIVLAPNDTLRRARQLMEEHRLRRFPVLEEGALVGIVTDRDVRSAGMSSAVMQERRYVEYLLDRIQVGGIMTPHPITVTPETPLMEAASIILEKKIGGLPVVDGEGLVGMITETDLIKALIDLEGGASPS